MHLKFEASGSQSCNTRMYSIPLDIVCSHYKQKNRLPIEQKGKKTAH